MNSVEKILGRERVTFSTSTETVDLVVDQHSIAWIVLNNKSKSVNIIGINFVSDMKKILEITNHLIDDKKVRVIVFYSDKSTFLAGADIHGMYPLLDERVAVDVARNGQRLFDRINAIKVPTVAAINGSALGGGLELCLACTYRIATKNKRAQIGLPEVKLGLIPGAGGTVRLPKIVGLQDSLKIILPGASVSPNKAKSIGLVDYLVEYEDRFPGENRFFEEVRTIAGRMFDMPPGRKKDQQGKKRKAHQSMTDHLLDSTWIGRQIVANQALKGLDRTTRGKYPASYRALESIMNSFKVPTSRALDFEALAFGGLAVSAEAKNLMSVFFLQEQAKKLDTARISAQPMSVQKVAVIGAGVMGSGIAHLYANRGFHVYMKDIKEEFVNKGLAFVADLFQKSVKRGRLTPEEAHERTDRVQGGTDYAPVSTCQIVIEAAVERMDLKKRVLQECEERFSSDRTIFATNTSTLSINELATASRRPENVIGCHYFNPVHKMPLVEIIRGRHTSDEAVATVYAMNLKLGKVPIVVNDGPGFLVNRILGIYMLEAGRLLKEGGNIKQIDDVILNFGMPMGPFRLLDEVGIDVATHSSETLQSLGERYAVGEGLSLATLVQKGYLGKKTNKGFYRYKDGKSVGVESTLVSALPGYNPKTTKHFPVEDIVDRCVLLMVNEAAYILEERIAETPEDVDLGMVFGTGFAPFRGGLLAYADNRGAKAIVKRLVDLQKRFGDRFSPAPLLSEMAAQNRKFFPDRPNVVLQERMTPPRAKL